MSQGVLAFVRGIDLTRIEFKERTVPEQFQDLASLRWLRLNHSTLESLPPQIAKLKKLEHIHIAHNQMKDLTSALVLLPRLRTVNARYNELEDDGIPEKLFALEELSTVDFSHNELENIPENLDEARGLQVLSLSHNKIKELPKALFVELNDLHHLDLSDNKLETIPPQLRRLHHLNTLNLANNPLAQSKLRALRHLNSLTVLNLSNTQRSLSNLPDTLHEGAPGLQELDLSHNSFTIVPSTVYELTNLRRVNFSHNEVVEVTQQIEVWIDLVTFNFCHNKLKALPNGICKLADLRRIFVSDNLLTFDGIPVGIGRLTKLEVFLASRNHLQCIPDGLCRCAKLRRLVLNNNELVTLPEPIHFLKNLEVLDLRHNPNLVMPPKPPVETDEAAAQFYNIDFDIEKLKRGITATVKPNSSAASRKHKLLVGRKRQNSIDNGDANASVLLQGMSRAHGASERHRGGSNSIMEMPESDSSQAGMEAEVAETEQAPIKAKRWDEVLARPDLRYNDLFPDDTGKMSGLSVWGIENFVPVLQDSVFYGQFYEGDCYIVLKTFVANPNTYEMDWQIYYWCGKDATMDKLACSAIHAVNLRNMLGARGRTRREEQSEESEEFLALFDDDLMYIEGGSASGFYSQEERRHTSRFYRMSGSKQLHFEAVRAIAASLDPDYVFILDSHDEMFVWAGPTSSLMCRQKSRLLAEKINKNDHKDKKKVCTFPKGEANKDFWAALNWEGDEEPVVERNVGEFKPARPTLHRVVLGHGFLELPQVDQPNHRLEQHMLSTNDVFILDCSSAIFVWVGRKSARLVRAAALKLSAELCSMLPRRPEVLVTRVTEGTESLVFKSKFPGWDDVMAVDYTKIPGFGKARPKLKISLEGTKQDKSGGKTRADGTAAPQRPEEPVLPKVDMSALFSGRVEDTPDEEAIASREEFNIDLAEIKCFVLDGKKFVKLPPEEEGHCYSECSYVFLCRYFVPNENDDEDEEESFKDELDTTVYFWQGHGAQQMGWLTFTFSFQKKIEQLIGDNLNVKQVPQQQESPRLLAHFNNKLIIHQGSRKDPRNKPALFQMKSNGGLENTRTVELPCTASSLNSAFCYVLRVPFESDGGIVYGWRGSKAHKHHSERVEEVAKSLCDEGFALQLIDEGSEPENFFWVGLGGKAAYETNEECCGQMRLFRCSNEKGFFSISEKCADFCQTDLANDDVMVLDSGSTVFVWIGAQASDVESKLGAKSAQLYGNYWGEKEGQKKRQLRLVRRQKETPQFKACFHGWIDWAKHRGGFMG